MLQTDCGQRSTPSTPPAGSEQDRWWSISRRLVRGRAVVSCYLTVGVSAAAFWIAVAVPFLYFPLVLGGLEHQGELVAFVALLVVNIVALRLGHHYRNPAESDERGASESDDG